MTTAVLPNTSQHVGRLHQRHLDTDCRLIEVRTGHTLNVLRGYRFDMFYNLCSVFIAQSEHFKATQRITLRARSLILQCKTVYCSALGGLEFFRFNRLRLQAFELLGDMVLNIVNGPQSRVGMDCDVALAAYPRKDRRRLSVLDRRCEIEVAA